MKKPLGRWFRFFHQEMLAFCAHVWRATNGSGGFSFRAAARIGLRALPSSESGSDDSMNAGRTRRPPYGVVIMSSIARQEGIRFRHRRNRLMVRYSLGFWQRRRRDCPRRARFTGICGLGRHLGGGNRGRCVSAADFRISTAISAASNSRIEIRANYSPTTIANAAIIEVDEARSCRECCPAPPLAASKKSRRSKRLIHARERQRNVLEFGHDCCLDLCEANDNTQNRDRQNQDQFCREDQPRVLVEQFVKQLFHRSSLFNKEACPGACSRHVRERRFTRNSIVIAPADEAAGHSPPADEPASRFVDR